MTEIKTKTKKKSSARSLTPEPPRYDPEEVEALIAEGAKRIAYAVGRLVGARSNVDLSEDVGLGLLGIYGEVKGDSILTSFARGAMEKKKSVDDARKPTRLSLVRNVDSSASPSAWIVSLDEWARKNRSGA